MKRKTIARILFSLVLACCCSMPVRAQETAPLPEAQEGMYTVRFYSGKQGTFNDTDVMTISGGGQSAIYRDEEMVVYQVPYGTQITVNPYAAQIGQPGKYYTRGIRESGKDNQETLASFTVTEDRDYVVAYGVLSDSVAYTIRYLDQNGNELAREQTFYGNVGDRLIIGFRYFDGYQPQAYNLAKTLTNNAADNIFPFVYTPVQTTGGGGGGGGGTPAPGTTPGGENPVTPPAGGAAGPGTTPTAPEGGGEAPGGGEAAPEGPQEILDLDEQEVPLAGGEENPQGNEDAVAGETETGFNWPLVAACIALLVVAGGLVALWYIKRRRKQEEKEEEEE